MTTPFERDYLKLCEAFQRLGRFRFPGDWTEKEIAEENSGQIVTDAWLTESLEQERYKQARLDLLEQIYKGRIKAAGMNPRAVIEEIPDYIWKDLGGYQISIRDGRITHQGTDPPTDWRVRIDRRSFEEILLEAHLRRLSIPPSTHEGEPKRKKYDAPGSIDWREIDLAICNLYASHDPPKTAVECAERLIAQFGNTAPSVSRSRGKVAYLLKIGLLEP